MSIKRILVVDDDINILRMLEFGLKKLGEYQVITADDMFGALKYIESQKFDLVLTDYMMPGLTGIDLARAVHKLSPQTQVVLMTAYGTPKLRDTSTHIGFDGYLNKPFDVETVRTLLNNAEHETDSNKPPANTAAPQTAPAVSGKTTDSLLHDLLINSGVRAVMLIGATGVPIKTLGQVDPKKIPKIATLVASSFRQTSELANLLDNQKIFKSGLYEGDAFNIYVCDVNESALLAVIFDVKLRPGVVWFYSKQTAAELSSLLS